MNLFICSITFISHLIDYCSQKNLYPLYTQNTYGVTFVQSKYSEASSRIKRLSITLSTHCKTTSHSIIILAGQACFLLTKEFTFDYPMVVLPIVLPCFTAELIATCRVMSSALALALKHLALVGKSSGASASATLRKI